MSLLGGKMNFKKIILIIIFLFGVTGCKVNYEATIENNQFIEKSTFIVDKNSTEKYGENKVIELLPNFIGSYIPSYYNPENYDDLNPGYQSGIEYYNIVSNNTLNEIGIDSNYSFDYYNFYRSRVIHECYSDINVQKNDSVYRVITNNGCQAFKKYNSLDAITIKININYDVIYNNADEINGNTYIWYLTKANADNKNIRFTYNTLKKDLSNFNANNTTNESKMNEIRSWADSHQVIIILGMMTLFLLTIIIIKKISLKQTRK